MRFLSYFRANQDTSSMIGLIFKVIANTKSFLLFMIVFMFCLSCSFYLLHTDNLGEDPSFMDTFLLFYDSTMGDTDGITDYDLAFSSLTTFFSIGSSFIFAIILLNLLVSIIGDIHGENKEIASKTRLFELIGIMTDVEHSTTTKTAKYFGKKKKLPRYLIQLSNEKHEVEEENPFEGLEDNIDEKIKINNQKTEKMITAVDNKLIAFRENMDKTLEMLSDKLDAGLERMAIHLDKQTQELNEFSNKQTKEIEKIVDTQTVGIGSDLNRQKLELENIFEKKLFSPEKRKKKMRIVRLF